MKKINTLKIKMLESKKIFYSIISFFFIITTLMFIHVIQFPNNVVYEKEENTIVEETTISVKADIVPNILNPPGGIVDLNDGVFTNVTKEILVYVDSTIKADKPIKIEGTKKLILKLIADDLWEKEYTLSEEKILDLKGANNKLFEESHRIGLDKLIAFTKKVEEELNIRPSVYKFNIIPVFDGTISYDDKTYLIDQNASSIIEYGRTQIKLGEQVPFSRSTLVTSDILIPQNLKVLNMGIPMGRAKIFSISLYMMALITLCMAVSRYNKLHKTIETEAFKLNKKYKARLINIKDDVQKLEYEKFELDSFDGILTISDEKQCPIFKSVLEDEVLYYVVDQGFMYFYKADNYIENEKGINDNVAIKGVKIDAET